ncbi:MAG: hypothetical protein AB1814_15635 [Thermodesulfobacteriota bacterium]
MATKIRPTPRLNQKDTIKFLKMVSSDLKKPSRQKCDPAKLENARQKALHRDDLPEKQ